MAVQDNRPQLQTVLNKLAGLPPALLNRFAVQVDGGVTYPEIQQELTNAIAWVEDQCATAFNGTFLPPYGVDYQPPLNFDFIQDPPPESNYRLADGTLVGFELYDGNTTNQIVLRKRPVLEVAALQVVTPILGYTRVYLNDEIKNYARQGVVKVFTYKLAIEQALLQSIDYQAWGNLFPPLPQAVQIAYCYGFPLFDPSSSATDARTGQPINGPATSLTGGHTWLAGDQRDPELQNWLTNLQEAAVCQACAQFLASPALAIGLQSSVSFDGYSRSLSPATLMQVKESFEKRRDELIGRRKRAFFLSSVGGV